MQVEDKLQEEYEVFMYLSLKVLEAQKRVTQAIKAHHQSHKEASPDETASTCMERRREGTTEDGGREGKSGLVSDWML